MEKNIHEEISGETETPNSDQCVKEVPESSTVKRGEEDHDEKKEQTSNQSETNIDNPEHFASIVAAHYNSHENLGLLKRNDSKIVYLRNFNNWIKSLLTKRCLDYLPEERKWNLKVLDMCCGKGGDLIKWFKNNVKHLICADISENSLKQCKERFSHLVVKLHLGYKVENEIILADCTRVHLRRKYRDPSIQLDVVSCQFSFHYCFESLPQAECMLKNVSECLKPGGVFIGTMPNANEIVKRLKKSGSKSLKNSVFSLEMFADEPYPLFGAKYLFYLEGVVNCPEFLVHFPTFEKLAAKFDLFLVERKRFDEIYQEKSTNQFCSNLLRKIKALETYPPFEGQELNGSSEDYVHASTFCLEKESKLRNRKGRIGTLPKSQWEVITLYETFIFQKKKTGNQ